MDKSEHPFCGGATEDVRITTRYSDVNPFSSLEGVMHETGHALYELGLPKEWHHQPAGKSRGMAMHESQSLLIEMQITRSLAFKKFLSSLLKESFNITGKEFSFKNLYKLGTRGQIPTVFLLHEINLFTLILAKLKLEVRFFIR